MESDENEDAPNRHRSLNWTDDSSDRDNFDWSESYGGGQGLRFSFSSSSTSPKNLMEVDFQGNQLDSPLQEITPAKHLHQHHLPSLKAEFNDEYYLWNIELELKYHPVDSLANQPQVMPENRSALIGWLSRVSRSIDFFPETLFLTVNIVDRFLVSTPIALECLQLVGLAALFVAAKEVDVYHPTISELLILASGNYTRHHFLQMEKIVLNQLKFQLIVPTCVVFLNYYVQLQKEKLKASSAFVQSNSDAYELTRNVLELCVQDYQLIRYHPSALALGAMAVVEEYKNGGLVDEPETGHWELIIVKQCASDIWSYFDKILTVPLSNLAEETCFYKQLMAHSHHI